MNLDEKASALSLETFVWIERGAEPRAGFIVESAVLEAAS